MNIDEYIRQSEQADTRFNQDLVVQREAALVPVSRAVLQQERDEAFQTASRLQNGWQFTGKIAQAAVDYTRKVDIGDTRPDPMLAAELIDIRRRMINSSMNRVVRYTRGAA